MDPALALELGTSALQFLRPKRKIRSYKPRPFSFTPDPNDPELLLRHTSIGKQSADDYSSTLNEINRAGLSGSGTAFELLGEQNNRKLRALDEADNEVNASRRQEALQRYMDEEHFRQQLSLMDEQNAAESDSRATGAAYDALGDVGDYLGGQIPSGRVSYLKYLMDNDYGQLPTDELYGASQYVPSVPQRRGYR